jgi:hypothetical protein
LSAIILRHDPNSITSKFLAHNSGQSDAISVAVERGKIADRIFTSDTIPHLAVGTSTPINLRANSPTNANEYAEGHAAWDIFLSYTWNALHPTDPSLGMIDTLNKLANELDSRHALVGLQINYKDLTGKGYISNAIIVSNYFGAVVEIRPGVIKRC